ncbi:chorismate mutase [Serratia marcescens]|nr:chorismate mutase [Serratia marcescens]MBH2866157.1 chorismate mutase [Serratia marcescens]MBW4239738.1 chorismate mutase [Enterobacter roggenkampii]
MTNKSVALDKLRQDIDTIDNQLVRLLTDRMNIALNIADMKANSVDEVLPVTESK